MEPKSLLYIDSPPLCALASSFLTQLLFHVFVPMHKTFQTICTFPSSTYAASYFKAACLQWSLQWTSTLPSASPQLVPSSESFSCSLFLLQKLLLPLVSGFCLAGPRTLFLSVEVAKTLLLISQPPPMILWSSQHQGWNLTHSSADRISDFGFVNGWMDKCTRSRLQG